MRKALAIPPALWAAATTDEARDALRDEYSVDLTPEEIAAREAEASEGIVDTLLAYLDDVRWRREQGGVTVGGLDVLTRDRDKTLITGKITRALILGTPDTDTFTFTIGGADITITIGQLKVVGVAIADHVQRTIDAAAVVRPDIINGTLTTAEQVDAAFTAAYASLLTP